MCNQQNAAYKTEIPLGLKHTKAASKNDYFPL